MRDILFARKQESRIARPELNRNRHLVLASGLDYELYLLDLPPVPQREMERLISYRLRTVHPGASEHTRFDYFPEGGWHATRRPGHRSESQRIRVYVMREDVFTLYSAAAEAGVLATADILADASEHRPAESGAGESRTVGIVFENHIEVFRYQQGKLVAARKSEMPDGDPARALQDLFDGYSEALDLYAAQGAEESSEQVRSAETLAGRSVTVHPLTELAEREGRRSPSRTTRTFEPEEHRRRRLSRPGRRMLLFGVPAAVVLLVLFLAWNAVAGSEQRLASVKHAYEVLSRTTADAAHANEARRAAQAELDALTARRPRDTYGFFDAVARAAPAGTVVREARLGLDAFTVEAETNEPFVFAEHLAADNRFSDVRVVQSEPNPQAPAARGERCTIAGSYHGG